MNSGSPGRARNEKAFEGFLKTAAEYSMIPPGCHVAAGLSGGADSAALFHMLACRCGDIKVTAVHVNHGLRGRESDRDEDFCRELAARFGAEIIVYRFDVELKAREAGLSIEEAGREARYEAYGDAMRKTGARRIALGHNKNDNAETIVMRFFRGAGLRGLAGIPPVRGDIVRPLLFTERRDIEDYCRVNMIEFRTDASNLSGDYTRNRVRLDVLPMIRERFNPAIDDTLSGAAGMMSAEDRFLDRIAGEALGACAEGRDEDGLTLDALRLAEYDPVIAARAIRLAYGGVMGGKKDLSRAHTEAVMAILLKTNKTAMLPGGAVARAERGKLSVLKTAYRTPPPFLQSLKENAEAVYVKQRDIFVSAQFVSQEYKTSRKDLKKLYTIGVDYDKIKDGLCVRSRLPGDMIYIKGTGRKKLKDCLSSMKLLQKERDGLFYVADGTEIIAVLSRYEPLRLSGHYAWVDGARGVFITFWEG